MPTNIEDANNGPDCHLDGTTTVTVFMQWCAGMQKAALVSCHLLWLVCWLVLSCKGEIICKCSNSSCKVEAELVTSTPVFEGRTNITATCRLENVTGHHCNFTSEEIFFKYLGTRVNSDYVSVVNETTSRVMIENVTSDLDGTHIFCFLHDYISRLRDGTVLPMKIGQAVIRITDRPARPHFKGCMVYNWLSMNCTWEPAVPEAGTKQTLFWAIIRSQGEHYCPIQKQNWCFWPSIEDKTHTAPSYRRNFPYYLRIQAENIIGTESDSIKVTTDYKVKPDLVKPNIHISSTTLDLMWHSPIPVSLKHHHYLLLYNIKVMDLDKVIKHEENITTVNHTIWHTVSELSPFTNYTVLLACIPVIGDEPKGFWSDSDVTSLRTHSDVPGASPVITPGGYTLIQLDNQHNTVKINWQPVHSEDAHGANLTTRIEAFKLTEGAMLACSGHEQDVFFPAVYLSSFELRLDLNVAYAVCIDVFNENGYNRSNMVEPLVIPSSSQAPAVPEFFAEGRGNNISVMWKRQDGASGYTLYWCTGHLHCDKKGYFIWRNFSNTSESAQLNLPPGIMYQSQIVALSAEYRDHHYGTTLSSGMLVTDCIFSADKDPAMPTGLLLLDIQYESNSLAVQWNKPACEMTGYIKSFLLLYCVKDSKKHSCKSKEDELLVPVERRSNRNVQEHIIPNLNSDTTYLVRIAGIGNNNKSSIYSEAVMGHLKEQGWSVVQKVMIWLTIVLGMMIVVAGIISTSLYIRKKWNKRFAMLHIIIPEDPINEDIMMRHYTTGGVYADPSDTDAEHDVVDVTPMLPNGIAIKDAGNLTNGHSLSCTDLRDRRVGDDEALLRSQSNSINEHCHNALTNIDSYNIVTENLIFLPTQSRESSGACDNTRMSSVASSGTCYIPPDLFTNDISCSMSSKPDRHLNSDGSVDRSHDAAVSQSNVMMGLEERSAVYGDTLVDVVEPIDIIRWDTNLGEVTLSQKQDNITCDFISSGYNENCSHIGALNTNSAMSWGLDMSNSTDPTPFFDQQCHGCRDITGCVTGHLLNDDAMKKKSLDSTKLSIYDKNVSDDQLPHLEENYSFEQHDLTNINGTTANEMSSSTTNNGHWSLDPKENMSFQSCNKSQTDISSSYIDHNTMTQMTK